MLVSGVGRAEDQGVEMEWLTAMDPLEAVT